MGEAELLEEATAADVAAGDAAVDLVEAKGLETVVDHEADGRGGVAFFLVLAVVNHDADAGPLVVGVEVVEVDEADGLAGLDELDDEAELLGGVDVEVGVLEVFLEGVDGEVGERVADFPEVHVVFPLVEVF